MPRPTESKRDQTALALYVHIPFCVKKCAYCDFTSYAGKESEIPDYITHVLDEWAAIRRELLKNQASISTLYLGGGTPSLLTENQMTRLVRGLFPEGIDPSMEATVEANPESLTPSKLACYQELGINRVSVGIQSFSDAHLRLLGRLHSARRARECLDMIRRAGWRNFSMDLMYGLPGQSHEDFLRDLDEALGFEPPHLSTYCLTLSGGVPLGQAAARGAIHLPPEAEILKMMASLDKTMASHGYEHYEVSNFARPGHACRHNLAYWTLSPYIGLGAGAVSFFIEEVAPWGSHWENPGSLSGYAKRARNHSWAFHERSPLSHREALIEALLTGLRLKRGLSIRALAERFGEEAIGPVLQKAALLAAEGWCEMDGGSLRITPGGSCLLDTLVLELIPES